MFKRKGKEKILTNEESDDNQDDIDVEKLKQLLLGVQNLLKKRRVCWTLLLKSHMGKPLQQPLQQPLL